MADTRPPGAGDPVAAAAARVEASRVGRAESVEANRVDRADAVEAGRADLAASLETDRSDLADAVEGDRSDRADVLELDRTTRAALIESIRVDTAAQLEVDRKLHNARIEAKLQERTKVVNRRFWFLFVALTLAFMLMAYRSENNATAISTGLHEACLTRVETATQYNKGREALVQLSINSPRTPPRTEAEKAALVKQLRDGLLLPIEDCGPPPP